MGSMTISVANTSSQQATDSLLHCPITRRKANFIIRLFWLFSGQNTSKGVISL